MSDSGWCTIESDPAVFTEMLQNLGVKDVAVEELVSLDTDSLQALGTVHGLILLFKWQPQARQANFQADAQLYFAKQMIQNACATQALLNILLNHAESITLGETLAEFHKFTMPLDPKTRGELVGQADKIREVHNSFTRSSVFSFEQNVAKEDDDAYHFVAFVHKYGAIWELDGLQPSPILCGDATADNWRDQMVAAVQSRITEISAADTKGQGQGISFSLLAVVDDRLSKLELDLALLQSEEKPTGLVEAQIAQIKEERERGHLENVRRRHNYIPMLVALFRALAEKGKLDGIVKQAKETAAASKEARKKGSNAK